MRQILIETRDKGYGTRDPTFGGGAYGRQSPDGLAGIAVPLLDNRRVHGVINIIWSKAAKTVEDMVQDHLIDLRTRQPRSWPRSTINLKRDDFLSVSMSALGH